MGDDGRPQPVVEHQPEEHHSHEPRVDVPDDSEVLVAVSEACAGRDDCGAQQPVVTHELGLELAERRPVGKRDHQLGVPPVHEVERDGIESADGHHGAEEEEPSEDELFEHSSVHADPETLEEGLSGLMLPILAVAEPEGTGQEGCSCSPEEDEPDTTQSLADVRIRLPELVEIHDHPVTSDPPEESIERKHYEEINDVRDRDEHGAHIQHVNLLILPS